MRPASQRQKGLDKNPPSWFFQTSLLRSTSCSRAYTTLPQAAPMRPVSCWRGQFTTTPQTCNDSFRFDLFQFVSCHVMSYHIISIQQPKDPVSKERQSSRVPSVPQEFPSSSSSSQASSSTAAQLSSARFIHSIDHSLVQSSYPVITSSCHVMFCSVMHARTHSRTYLVILHDSRKSLQAVGIDRSGDALALAEAQGFQLEAGHSKGRVGGHRDSHPVLVDVEGQDGVAQISLPVQDRGDPGRFAQLAQELGMHVYRGQPGVAADYEHVEWNGMEERTTSKL
mmetsp:Transcript_11452/g.32951  ORF Transcript_11452/g.32951 Transcript_11452/m.32951 type:complete len:282 (-) Transcript_11452:395-1240(-)